MSDESPTLTQTDWQRAAKKLLQKNLSNLAKKVVDGKTLSAAEVAMLQAEVSGDEGQSSKSSLAKNKSRLAEILGVSRKTIQRYVDHPEAPNPKANGSLDIEAWRAFLAEHDVLEDPNGDLDKSSLQAKQILLQNKLLQQKIDQNDRILVKSDDVEREVAEMIGNAKTVLLQGPSSLAPQVVGVSVQEAESILRQWLFEALSKLKNDPLGRGNTTEVEDA